MGQIKEEATPIPSLPLGSPQLLWSEKADRKGKEYTMLTGWLDEVESEVVGYLQDHEPASLQDLASGLRISEALALSYISILAREGKLTISGLGIRDQVARVSRGDRDLKRATV